MYNLGVGSRLISRFMGLSLFLISVLLLVWGLRGVSYDSITVVLGQNDLDSSESASPKLSAEQPAGRILLEWPQRLRPGDAGEVRLTFYPEPLPQGVRDLDRILQSRLELAGITQTPTGEISQLLTLEHPVAFLWNLRSNQMGNYPGDVWLYVRQYSQNEAQKQRKVVLSHHFDFPVSGLLGLSGLQARILGSVGLVVGIVLGLGERIFRNLDHDAKWTARKDDKDA